MDNIMEEYDIYIPGHNEAPFSRIGVFMTGGIDSTLLMCMVIEELQRLNRNDIELHAFTVYKPDGPTEYAPRIIKMIEEHYNVKIHHTNNMPNSEKHIHERCMDPTNIQRALDTYDGDLRVYLGANNVPPIAQQSIRHKRTWTYKERSHYHMPLLTWGKDEIIEKMYDMEIEHLIPYTHSCSRQLEGACGICFSCEEREWGFKRLGRIDPGTIPL